MELAPILVFAYNRPRLLKQTLQSLSENELAGESILYIHCDGPRANATPEQLQGIREVRKIADDVAWSRELHVRKSETNSGLARSVIAGVSDVVEKHGRVIVVEDDVLLSRYFLRFMNDALEKYSNEEKVLSIGSWNYFADPARLNGNFFLRYPDSIAWATYSRAWRLFGKDPKHLLDQLNEKNLMPKFNCDLPGKYFENMLNNQAEGKIDSWAIRWTATSVVKEKLNYYPAISLSKHMGFGGDATHEKTTHDYNEGLKLALSPVSVGDMEIKETEEAIGMWRAFIQREFQPNYSLFRRIVRRLKGIF